jgi:carbonic anhydrase
MIAQNAKSQAKQTHESALNMLKEGNARFLAQKMVKRDLTAQIRETSTGQYPFASILSCIDSRVPVETIFDMGIGDLFSARVAGNVINDDLLGSLEFACKLAGTKLLVVLGHSSCGAVKGACDGVYMGNLTSLLNKIQPAVRAVEEPGDMKKRNSKNLRFVDDVAMKNVELTLGEIRYKSPILKDLEDLGEIRMIGAFYHIETGEVTWLP